MKLRFLHRVPVSVRLAMAALLGVLGGLAWHRFVGCRSGGCPLTSNPWLMALFGAAMGLSLGWPDGGIRSGRGPKDPGQEASEDRNVV